MKKLPRIAKIGLGAVAVTVVFFALVFLLIVYGEPIHDINLWLLQKKFYTAKISHPSDSVLVEKKTYLGGPSLHGDSRCIYAVGEVRTAPLSKANIRSEYSAESIYFGKKTLQLRLLFADEYEGPYTMPYVDWQDELRETQVSEDTLYVVYVSTGRPVFFYDGRCYD